MPKHDELIPLSSKHHSATTDFWTATCGDETEVCCDYRKADAQYIFQPTERVVEATNNITGALFRIWNEHLATQAGRANPRYWRGSRTA